MRTSILVFIILSGIPSWATSSRFQGEPWPGDPFCQNELANAGPKLLQYLRQPILNYDARPDRLLQSGQLRAWREKLNLATGLSLSPATSFYREPGKVMKYLRDDRAANETALLLVRIGNAAYAMPIRHFDAEENELTVSRTDQSVLADRTGFIYSEDGRGLLFSGATPGRAEPAPLKTLDDVLARALSKRGRKVLGVRLNVTPPVKTNGQVLGLIFFRDLGVEI